MLMTKPCELHHRAYTSHLCRNTCTIIRLLTAKKNFVCRENMKIFHPNRYVHVYTSCDKSWNNSWGSASQLFLPRQTIKAEAFFQWWFAFKQHIISDKLNTYKPADWISDKICSLPVHLSILWDALCMSEGRGARKLWKIFVQCLGLLH